MSDIKELINKAWNLRWAQEIESTVELYTRIQNKIHENPPDDANVKTEMALLWISLLRAQGRQAESGARLKLIEETLLLNPVAGSNHFYFERGLARYVGCDYIGAYEDFTLFTVKATDAIERMAGLINKLLCLENMGFETRKTEEECRLALETNKAVTALPWPQMRRHYLGFVHRKNFRMGGIKELLSSADETYTSLDYAKYLEQWTKLLPYHSKALTDDSGDITREMISGLEHLYHKSYRLRSLTFKWHPDDVANASLSDVAERLYLWVWNWMAAADRVSPEKIGFALKAVADSKALSLATPFEAALIRNSIAWLCLFNNDLMHSVRAIAVSCQSILNAQSMPLLDLEYSLAQLMKSAIQYGKKMMDDNEVLLTTHPLWNNENILFKAIYGHLRNPDAAPTQERLKRLGDRLRTVVFKDEDARNNSGIQVEVRLTDYSIEHVKSGNSIVSEPLARAIAHLSRNESSSASELMRECFGIRTFDPIIHNTKLYNLIARVKSILSGIVNVKTRQMTIYTEGEWSRVAIKTIDPMLEVLRDETKSSVALIAESIGRKRRSRKNPVTLLERGKHYSRNDLAELFGGSRATIIRTINALIADKKLKRKGSSRSTKYLVLSNISSEDSK